MPTNTLDRLTTIQDKVVETVHGFQEPVVNTVKKVVDLVEQYVPEFPTERFAEGLPTARELIDNQYAFAGRLLKTNQEIVDAVLEAVEPVTEKVVKPAPKTIKKAVKKVAEAA
jgi:hypothetical protein